MARAWFKDTFGFDEESFEAKDWFTLKETPDSFSRTAYTLIGKNGKEFHVGPFECLTVNHLRCKAEEGEALNLGPLTFNNIDGNVTVLHKNMENAGAVFQVASQFNCLEMVGPLVRPEDGITRYSMDHTQGPACALCCPAATFYRNYFANGGEHQLDLLKDVGEELENPTKKYWMMRNGYCLPQSPESIKELGDLLAKDEARAEKALGCLQVGIHWDTELSTKTHNVCQVFCSALPITYARHTQAQDWKNFASLVLDGAYDATLAAATVLAKQREKRVKVYLTALGGGAFGNPHQWIQVAIRKALERYRQSPLDVFLVHYGGAPKGFYEDLQPKKG